VFDFFFYGTLVDADVRRLVLGREVSDAAVQPAELAGFQRYAVQQQPFPAAVPQQGATVDGVIMPGASLSDAAMLTCFEGSDYEAQLCRVTSSAAGGRDQDAWVFVASDRVPRGEPSWLIDDWRAQHKPAFFEIAAKWLSQISDADVSAAEALWRQRSETPGAR
jgi:hypothetical protein